MSKHFTHLHLHTDYSLLDGAISIDKLIGFGKKHNCKALAISDHGNIFGAVKFFEKCKKAGMKPILGMEAYITEQINVKDNNNRYYHLLLLVQNRTGYKNLCKLIAHSYLDGFYFKPRIDYALLEKYSEGLITTSTCLGGHIPQLYIQERDSEAEQMIDRLATLFDGRYYLEVQPEWQDEQALVNAKLFDLAQRKGLPVFASGDCHYATQEDRLAHEVMLAIQTRHTLDDQDRMTFGDVRAHMHTPEEMLQHFKDHEEAVWMSGHIADQCEFDFETGKLFFPEFPLAENQTKESFFAEECRRGLQALFDAGRIATDSPDTYWNRLDEEVSLITSMGFITYFLVVSDFIKWAKRQNIPVGPGRGSAAGSLVAWALEITDIDPIRYNLLFERFLNPERITMPDIDIDFCIEGRERVINYVRERYGHDKVCQIITFGTLMAKGVIKDVARVLGIPFDDANALTNLIPDQLKITLGEALEQEPKLKQMCESNPKIAQLFDIAFRLEGLTRHASKHAAGIVISPEPISDVLPIYVPPKTTDIVTQYAMTELESLGFLKMDFLGLKNLTLIRDTLALIKQNHGIDLDIAMLPLDDEKTFKLLGRGDTSGVFQLESSGLKDVLRRLQPEYFEDIIAVNALYRPGPLGSGMVDDFIERRHGRQKISYLFPELEPILKETYGVIVYQEQVMKIASAVGGYSLGEADILRRAMGKKKAEVMAEQKALFTKRAVERGFHAKKADELFELMAYFAGYGFNKSHSAAYAMIAYQTAYLKAHYPAEFMACLISLEAEDSEKMAFYIQEAKSLHLAILPPDINISLHQFSTRGSDIIFGLRGVKNVGDVAINTCIEERKKGPFSDLLEFCMRMDLRTCNKRVIENLIAAGAFDSLPGNRAQKMAELATIMERAVELKEHALTGQMGLFDTPKASNGKPEGYVFKPLPDWSTAEKLAREKDVLGAYISALPLDSYRHHIKWLGATRFTDAHAHQGMFIGCGTVATKKVIATKKGDKMAFLELEDYSGSAEIVIFPKLYSKVEPLLESETIFVVVGSAEEATEQKCKIKATDLIPIERLSTDDRYVQKVTVRLPEDWNTHILNNLRSSLTTGSTALELQLTDNGTRVCVQPRETFAISTDLLKRLEDTGCSISLHLS